MPLGLDPRTFNTPPHSERLPQPNPRSQDELAKSLRQRCRAPLTPLSFSHSRILAEVLGELCYSDRGQTGSKSHVEP